jgi:hypothetical protein
VATSAAPTVEASPIQEDTFILSESDLELQ